MAGRLLEGLRALDLTRVVAGPFATAIFADLGAEVIKIERPGPGDDYRHGPAPEGETSLSFLNTNRGKRSVTLDFRAPEGREILLRLVDVADVLVENFRAGYLARCGLGADLLQARNPRLVGALAAADVPRDAVHQVRRRGTHESCHSRLPVRARHASPLRVQGRRTWRLTGHPRPAPSGVHDQLLRPGRG